MGTKIYDLVEKQEIEIEYLKHKVIAIDSFLFLYQFLASIRQQDGRLLTDNKGNVTSHLIGLFSRTTNFLAHGIKPIFVFDGESPELKKKVREKRKEIKVKAQQQYEEAVQLGDEASMRKFGSRTGVLSPEMLAETKELLTYLGMPIVQAPTEGEAQAAYIVKKGEAYAVGSNDADSLIFGAPRVVKNLGTTAKRKKPGTLIREAVPIELIELQKVLDKLGFTQDQLIILAMLVGTDYNPGGIKGIGPKKALAIVKKYAPNELFAEVKWNESFDYPWEDVFNAIKHVKVTDDYKLLWKPIDKKRLIELLCNKHDFALERVEKPLVPLQSIQAQSTLGSFI